MPGAGYTSLDFMKLATSYARQALRELTGPAVDPYREAKLGVVGKGAWADILIRDGDPTQNVKLVIESENLKLIMKDGSIYKNILNGHLIRWENTVLYEY
jgi:imidazolonepropionase-like amidohydrolase